MVNKKQKNQPNQPQNEQRDMLENSALETDSQKNSPTNLGEKNLRSNNITTDNSVNKKPVKKQKSNQPKKNHSSLISFISSLTLFALLIIFGYFFYKFDQKLSFNIQENSKLISLIEKSNALSLFDNSTKNQAKNLNNDTINTILQKLTTLESLLGSQKPNETNQKQLQLLTQKIDELAKQKQSTNSALLAQIALAKSVQNQLIEAQDLLSVNFANMDNALQKLMQAQETKIKQLDDLLNNLRIEINQKLPKNMSSALRPYYIYTDLLFSLRLGINIKQSLNAAKHEFTNIQAPDALTNPKEILSILQLSEKITMIEENYNTSQQQNLSRINSFISKYFSIENTNNNTNKNFNAISESLNNNDINMAIKHAKQLSEEINFDELDSWLTEINKLALAQQYLNDLRQELFSFDINPQP